MKNWILLFLLPLKIIYSQDITGGLNGQILDSLNKPIEGVEIIVSGTSLQGTRGTTTDSRGYFTLARLPSGIYKIDISSVNYQNLTYENFPVQLGTTSSLGIINLRSGVIKIPEVIIYDKKTVIDPTTTTVGGNLSFKTFDALPTDRNFRSIISLLPQVNESYLGDEANISGGTGPENIYYIDGANVTESFNATGSTNLPYNFVKEIQVKAGGYEPEYGRALGGIVNIITQSGSNEFHGQFFSFFTNNIFGGERRPGLEVAKIPNFTSYDLGFSIGGPIVPDKVWFFAAYNPTFDVENVELPGFGKFTDKRVTHLFAGKLNWSLSQSTNLNLSIFGDPFSEHRINTDIVEQGWTIANKDLLFRKWDEGTYNFSLHGWHSVNEDILVDVSASYLDHLFKYSPDAKFAPLFFDYTSNALSGGYGQISNTTETRLNLNTSLSFLLGSHSLKAGVQYEGNSYYPATQDSPSGSRIEKYSDSLYRVFYSFNDGGTERNRVVSAFAQDFWQISERFILNAGLRWDAQFMISSDGKLWQKITNEYQPRAGMIYLPGKIGSQKIFVSYARFYEEIPMVLVAVYGAKNPRITIDYDHNPLVDTTGGVTRTNFGSIFPRIPNLKGEYFDEFLLGYETEIFKYFKLTLKGTYRNLPQVIEDAYDPNTDNFAIGNPGSANVNFLPKLYRIYKSLEFTIQNLRSENYNLSISYVLSRNYGNYAGLFEDGAAQPNTSSLPDVPIQIPNDEGLLPNDRTHVFKISGVYIFDFGLTVGTSFFWGSGTPLTEFSSAYDSFIPNYFLSPRGTAGRTPALWDLNFRFTYDFGYIINSSFKPRLKLDLFHVFNQRTPVNYDQIHYIGIDQNGQPTDPNPNYLTPVAYQPPFTARLGLEVNF